MILLGYMLLSCFLVALFPHRWLVAALTVGLIPLTVFSLTIFMIPFLLIVLIVWVLFGALLTGIMNLRSPDDPGRDSPA